MYARESIPSSVQEMEPISSSSEPMDVVRGALDMRNMTSPVILASNCSEALSSTPNVSDYSGPKDTDVRSSMPSSVKEMDTGNSISSSLKPIDVVRDEIYTSVRDSNSSTLKSELPEPVKPSSTMIEEVTLAKETLDVNSYRQRAEVLEGLLELSAELLHQNILQELSIVLMPFGKHKVSSREMAI
ncbi:hypothetical protein V6N12_064584 [Hibiscus sabdariffa]|uniref:Uncharacterized protein n=1 Tax=Hibiscus sabdariffa TaxID=183260 RepID=A0ABR2G6Z7_9ROSI